MNFDFVVPTRILFGPGRFAELGDEVRRYGSRAVVVSGRSALRNGLVDRACALLREADVATIASPPVGADPTAREVDALIDAAARERGDLFVAIGGGSAIDAAKAAGAAADERGPVGPLVGRSLAARPGALPVVAIPTTAGTGAEVTRGAIITDEARGLKSGIRGDDVQPRSAICDPDLLVTMPDIVLADTVFDAFTHLVETAVVQKATPVSRALSEAGLARLRCVMDAPLDITDPETRTDLAFAALLGGINIATASSALPHRIQQAMGSIREVRCSHGRGLALVYRAWSRRARKAAPERFAPVAAALGMRDVEEACDRLFERLSLPDRLRAVGYRAEHLPTILEKVTGNIENDPIPQADRATIAAILEDSL